jgi:hypothetical protein
MSLTHLSLAEILHDHVTLEVESIDRMYLNVYVPALQTEWGAYRFLRHHRGFPVPSSALMAPISRAFIAAIEAFVKANDIPYLTFAPGQRKDEVVAPYLKRFGQAEGIYLVGKTQEKTKTFRTHKGHGPQTRDRAAQLYRSTAMVNHYYFYGRDRDFGPFFIKFSSYFPYTAKLCLNGHEYAKQQLRQAGIAFEALDNGFRTCADPARLQAICDQLDADKITALWHKWQTRLPQPFTAADRAAGYDYDLSNLQAEFALTQVFDRPLTGRLFFETALREHLDLGRPDQVQLLFARRVTRRTPGQFRTRVITHGVIPTLHIAYKRSDLKQYLKEGWALRTETTINDARDFRLGKRLHNLPALREVGFQANRRLLSVQTLSHNCALGQETFAQLTQPVVVGQQRAAALPFANPQVQALLAALVTFRFLPQGFASQDLRPLFAGLLGEDPARLSQGRMTYHLRRLRLHGLIARVVGTHRYQVTDLGWRVALFFTRVQNRVLRPGLAHTLPEAVPADPSLQRQFNKLDADLDLWIQQAMGSA